MKPCMGQYYYYDYYCNAEQDRLAPLSTWQTLTSLIVRGRKEEAAADFQPRSERFPWTLV